MHKRLVLAVGLLAGAAVVYAAKFVDIRLASPAGPTAAEGRVLDEPKALPAAIRADPVAEPSAGVVRASQQQLGLLPLSIGQPPPPPIPKALTIVDKVGGTTLRWPADGSRPSPLPVRPTGSLEFEFDRDFAGFTFDAKAGTSAESLKPTPTGKVLSVTKPAAGRHLITLFATPTKPKAEGTAEPVPQEIGSFEVIVGSADPGPTVAEVSNNRALPPTEAGRTAATNGSLTVYDRFLKLKGTAAVGSTVSFFLFDKTSSRHIPSTELEGPRAPNGAGQGWEFVLTLPEGLTPGKSYSLFVVQNEPDTRRFLPTPVAFKYAKFEQKVAAPKITSVRTTTAVTAVPAGAARTFTFPGEREPHFLLNELASQVVVTAVVPDDGALVLSTNEGEAGVPQAQTTNATPRVYTFSGLELARPTAPDGKTILRAQIFVGDHKVVESTVQVAVRTTGPYVSGSVFPTDFSRTPGVFDLKIPFNRENPLYLDGEIDKNIAGAPAGAADKIDHYVLKAVNDPSRTVVLDKDGKRTTDAAAINKALEGATASLPIAFGGLDKATNTVTLNLNYLAPGYYELVVNSTLKDIFGNALLDGADGSKQARFKLIVPVEKDLPVEAPGITGQPAPQTELPEYTPPRSVPEGFNPADKVESRVVRLYYWRDAHRVAQILRRDLKSYNRASVDTRHRAADRSRDIANQKADERSASEREAIGAANAARTAEARLKAAEASLLDIRDREAVATQALAAAVERVRLAPGPLAAAVDPAEQLRAELANAQAALDAAQADVTSATTKVTRVRGESEAADLKASQDEIKSGSAKQALADEKPGLDITIVTTTAAIQKKTDDIKELQTKIDSALKPTTVTPGTTTATPPEPKKIDVKPLEEQKAKAEKELTDLNTQLTTATTRLAELQKKVATAETDRTASVLSRTLKAEELDAATKSRDAAVARRRPAELGVADVRARLAPALQREEAARDQAAALQAQVDTLRANLDRAREAGRVVADDLVNLRGAIQTARSTELTASEKTQVKAGEELRDRENQFRREVAALKEDPDSYADADPYSPDPVRQVAVSVIGEGLIQIRGPMKGLNVARMMVNQMDSPVGQVRIAIHTVQVNGERADNMEKVVAGIQTHIDHTRFMTAQTAQMLRKSVVAVAARKAGECPEGDAQADRDQRYVYSFFGKDFIDELKALDSEFLRTGNKLLSLHSMDTTSLASALFLMALAKNSVRTEIMEEFRRQLAADLPRAEMSFLAQGSWNSCPHGCREKLCRLCVKEMFQPLARNAHFTSLLGFFSEEIGGDDTMAPVQREFIRLAQIYKARLVTELELKQRVLERSLVEDRTGTGKTYLTALTRARKEEEDAQDAQKRSADALLQTLSGLIEQTNQMVTRADAEVANLKSIPNLSRRARARFRTIVEAVFAAGEAGLDDDHRAAFVAERDAILGRFDAARTTGEVGRLVGQFFRGELDATPPAAPGDALLRAQVVLLATHVRKGRAAVLKESPVTYEDVKFIVDDLVKLSDSFGEFAMYPTDTDRLHQAKLFANEDVAVLNSILTGTRDLPGGAASRDPAQYRYPVDRFQALFHHVGVVEFLFGRVTGGADEVRRLSIVLSDGLRSTNLNLSTATQEYQVLKVRVLGGLSRTGRLWQEAAVVFGSTDEAVRKFLLAASAFQTARYKANLSRKPLDFKKFLDLLVDETEDKFIEQLEGTRAHTANIDNYVKRIATALEDDFNRQFYHPAFRGVRQTSRSWDVSVAQVETTTVLTNNRFLAKVSPAATFEFDLPKRDIFIQEAMAGAKAAVSDYGALLNDPTFLSLVQMKSGQPTSSAPRGLLNGSGVRNVLPGLPTDTDERILAQQAPGRVELGSQLQALVPDPSIYKFETGTGFEIRPVLSPDGQSVVFGFNYLYSTKIREPVAANEKHLGRVDRHFINTDVQLGNYELREISKYSVGLKASRTGQGVQLLQDIPGVGLLFRPAPSSESALQENIVLGQSTIFPTIFDLMGLRYAPAVADMDPLKEREDEFVARARAQFLKNRVIDYGASAVDDSLGINQGARREDTYRNQQSIPTKHPNGSIGPGLDRIDSRLQEGYDLDRVYPQEGFVPGSNPDGVPARRTDVFDGGPLPPDYGPLGASTGARPADRTGVAGSRLTLPPGLSPDLPPAPRPGEKAREFRPGPAVPPPAFTPVSRPREAGPPPATTIRPATRPTAPPEPDRTVLPPVQLAPPGAVAPAPILPPR